MLRVGSEAHFEAKARKGGVHALTVSTGENAARVFIENQLACLVAPQPQVKFIYAQPRAWFLPKPQTEDIELGVYTFSPGETSRVVLYDPNGKEAASGDTISTRNLKLKVGIKPEHAGRSRSFAIIKAKTGILESVFLSLGKNEPFIASHLSRLIKMSE